MMHLDSMLLLLAAFGCNVSQQLSQGQ